MNLLNPRTHSYDLESIEYEHARSRSFLHEEHEGSKEFLKNIKKYLKISKLLPGVETLSKSSWNDLKIDIQSGCLLGAFLIPQGMAYATIAGLPEIYGLYLSVISPFVYSLTGLKLP